MTASNEPRTEPITTRIPVVLLVSVDRLAERLNRPRSRLINEALRDLLAKHGEPEAIEPSVESVASEAA
jgi:predicted transcriptional regulator